MRRLGHKLFRYVRVISSICQPGWRYRGVCVLITLCLGCRPATPPQDAALRLVSTAPNLTEALFAIGAGDLLVGRSSACDHPSPQIAAVPIVGDYAFPWLEPTLAQSPTHILTTIIPDPQLKALLTMSKLELITLPCEELAQIVPTLLQLGQLTEHRTAAQKLAQSIQCGLTEAYARTNHFTRRPRTLLLFAPDTPITAGKRTFVSALWELAGGQNISRQNTAAYYHVSLEWIVQHDPEIILCLFDSSRGNPHTLLAQQMGWQSLSAVQEGRVYTLDNLAPVSRPGPRVLMGLQQFEDLLAHDRARRKQIEAEVYHAD